MTRTKAPPPPPAHLESGHKDAPLAGLFGFTQADLEQHRDCDVDAASFARCYREGYLITARSNIRRKGRH